MNFPDLFVHPPEQMTPVVRAAAERLRLRVDPKFGEPSIKVVGTDRAREIGTMLFVMRAGARTLDSICASVHPMNECVGALGLLTAAGYISRSGEEYELAIPVFDESDRTLVAEFLKLSGSTITAWLQRNYGRMERELPDLVSIRQGLRFPALFTQIWHELFGLATRDLVVAGLIENPRSPGSTWRGSIPALWRISIYQHKWQ